MPRLAAILLLWASLAGAQGSETPRWEVGLRYWYSSGGLQWSHNAQGIDPSVGNPTSILTYEEATAHAVELHARRNFGAGWFARGNAGVGWIDDGSFDDEDYVVGQFRYSDSTSPVKGNRLAYFTLDVGRDLWVMAEGRSQLGLFLGYHRWRERLDAYGLTYSVNLLGAPAIGDTVPAISNEATWNALRAGASFHSRISRRTRLAVDAAWVPYAQLRNDDSHWLRSDFGPVPNLRIRGRGHGIELDIALKHAFTPEWELSAGVRHWRLTTTSGTVSTVTFSAPLVELESQRTGFTLSVSRLW